jgi:RTX calcium-binding nonapeptide repeat (4 copies)
MMNSATYSVTVIAGAGNDTFEGGKGDDSIHFFGIGVETFLFDCGDGNDKSDVRASPGGRPNSRTLEFGRDINPDDLILARVDNNLRFAVKGSGGSIRLAGEAEGLPVDPSGPGTAPHAVQCAQLRPITRSVAFLTMLRTACYG